MPSVDAIIGQEELAGTKRCVSVRMLGGRKVQSLQNNNTLEGGSSDAMRAHRFRHRKSSCSRNELRIMPPAEFCAGKTGRFCFIRQPRFASAERERLPTQIC